MHPPPHDMDVINGEKHPIRSSESLVQFLGVGRAAIETEAKLSVIVISICTCKEFLYAAFHRSPCPIHRLFLYSMDASLRGFTEPSCLYPTRPPDRHLLFPPFLEVMKSIRGDILHSEEDIVLMSSRRQEVSNLFIEYGSGINDNGSW